MEMMAACGVATGAVTEGCAGDSAASGGSAKTAVSVMSDVEAGSGAGDGANDSDADRLSMVLGGRAEGERGKLAAAGDANVLSAGEATHMETNKQLCQNHEC